MKSSHAEEEMMLFILNSISAKYSVKDEIKKNLRKNYDFTKQKSYVINFVHNVELKLQSN